MIQGRSRGWLVLIDIMVFYVCSLTFGILMWGFFSGWTWR
jgi:hypothetical protein